MDSASLHEQWLNGDAVEVGRTIMTSLSPAERVSRAANLLELCRSRWRPIPAIDAVAALAVSPALWHEAHGAFRRVRVLTLQEERAPTSDVYGSLLFVAENTAKTIYNASGRSAPFDEDSPWWLAPNVLHFAAATRDPSLRDALWRALVGRSSPSTSHVGDALDED